jgi:hypothetical protein
MSTRPIGLLRRTASAFLAVILLTVQSGLEPRHACPVHEPGVGKQAAADQAGAIQHHHDSSSSTDSSTSESEHCCTCVGSCIVAVPALIATATGVSFSLQERTAGAAVVKRDARQHPLPRLLPFATAPPLS